MKIFAYSVRPDEAGLFETYARQFGIDLETTSYAPSLETCSLARGADAVSIVTTPVTEDILKEFKSLGIRYISTRTVGFEHIDIEAAKKLDIGVGNVSYSPHSVAEYAVMLILMSLRRMKTIMAKSTIQDYSLAGMQGRELHAQTVGVIGTGRLGKLVISLLKGFGCKILAYDIHQDESVAQDATYVPLDELLQRSDVITLHVPGNHDGSHLLGNAEFAMMKDKVVLVNTARGSLLDQSAFMDAVESGKIGYAALDVIADERGLYFNYLADKPLKNRDMSILRSYPNVLVTPHTAFYTDLAVSDMVEHSLKACMDYCAEHC